MRFDDVEIVERVAIDAAMHRLDLKEGVVGMNSTGTFGRVSFRLTNSGPNQRSVSMMPS